MVILAHVSMKNKKVTLEPSLEPKACGLDWQQRLALARTFERWAHQLRVSAAMLRPQPTADPKRLPRLSQQKAKLN